MSTEATRRKMPPPPALEDARIAFAASRDRIAAVMANPRASGVAGLPRINAGDEAAGLTAIANVLAETREVQAEQVKAVAGISQIARKSEGDIAGLRAELNQALQVVAGMSTNGTSTIGPVTQGIGARLVQQIERGEAEGFSALVAGNSTKARMKLEVGIRAALTHTGGSSTDNGMPSQPETGAVYGGPVRRLSLLDALPSRPTTRDAVEFVQINATGEAAEQWPEGSEKANIDLDGELARAEIVTIAAHTTASRQVLSDHQALAGVVDRVMRGKVSSKAENQLVNGTGAPGTIDGLLNQASTFIPSIASEPADIIGECLAGMVDDGYAPTFVLLNPLDWYQLQTQRAAPSGEYLFGSPTAPIPPSLWNTPVVLSSSLVRGTGIAIDAAYVTLLDREQVTVQASEHHNDNFTKNLVTVRAEARLGLEVADVFAVRKFDLTIGGT